MRSPSSAFAATRASSRVAGTRMSSRSSVPVGKWPHPTSTSSSRTKASQRARNDAHVSPAASVAASRRSCTCADGASGTRGLDDGLERLARRGPPREPLDDLGLRVPRDAHRPGVRLAVHDDEPLARGPQRLEARDARPPRRARTARDRRAQVPRVADARCGTRAGARPWRRTARAAPRRARRRRARRPRGSALPFERAQRQRDGLDRRDAVIVRLAADAVAARRGGREPELRQRREPRVAAQQLAGLPPRPVEHDERDGPGRPLVGQVDGVRSREQQVRRRPAVAARRARPITTESVSKSTARRRMASGRLSCASRTVLIGTWRSRGCWRISTRVRVRIGRDVGADADDRRARAARAEDALGEGRGRHARTLAGRADESPVPADGTRSGPCIGRPTNARIFQAISS